MDFRGKAKSELTEKRRSQIVLREARIKLYRHVEPGTAWKINWSLSRSSRLQRSLSSTTSSNTPSKTPSRETKKTSSEGHGSETRQSSTEMPRRRLSPSPQEESRPPFESTRDTWELWDNSIQIWLLKQHEARYTMGENAIRMVAPPIMSFWLEHDLRQKKYDIDGFLDEAGPLYQTNSIDNCTEVVIRHFAFQRKFSEIAKLEEQRRELDGPDYINRLSVVTHELVDKMNGFFQMLIRAAERHKEIEKRRYKDHRSWNGRRGEEGRGKYPGLSCGLPSPLRSELEIGDSGPDQTSHGTGGTVNDSSKPENVEKKPGIWGPNNPDNMEW
ncbi:hypothetical protein F4814DRAFT_435588 [Daldinia grandis]|nr:hypothetical protein F4814DRAFT_435588 [Daldinia grandis]